jgi:hypothetical protein
MHTGRFPDGGLIYPAMPFGSYTKVTRDDCDAIFAYLRSVPPAHQPNRPHGSLPCAIRGYQSADAQHSAPKAEAG